MSLSAPWPCIHFQNKTDLRYFIAKGKEAEVGFRQHQWHYGGSRRQQSKLRNRAMKSKGLGQDSINVPEDREKTKEEAMPTFMEDDEEQIIKEFLDPEDNSGDILTGHDINETSIKRVFKPME
jgi:hypothetical protein